MNTELSNLKGSSFLEKYLTEISPKLKEIDLFIKTSSEYPDIYQSAKVLDITADEINKIMTDKNISQLDKRNFFTVMRSGSSEICKLFKRELDCGSPYIYTRRDISYIYNLDLDTIDEVCDKLRITEATSLMLPDIFAAIQV